MIQVSGMIRRFGMANIAIDLRDNTAYIKKLSEMKKYDMPLAIRSTLNDLAFEQKKIIPKEAKKEFITRSKTFFRAFSTIQKANGFNVNTMFSLVGMQTKGLKALGNLAKQETAGEINKQSFIYNRDARGGSDKKQVLQNNLLNSSNILNGKSNAVVGKKKIKIKSKKALFVASAIMAQKTGKFMIFSKGIGSYKFALKVTGIYLGAKKSVSIKTQVMAVKKDGIKKYTLKTKHPFMINSTNETTKQIQALFIKNAEKRFAKALKV